MNIQHIGDDWGIQGNDIGKYTGYRCDEKSRNFHSFVSGDFSAESQYAGTMDIGKAQPIDKSSLSLKDNATTLLAGNVEVTSNFNADELNSLGFTMAR